MTARPSGRVLFAALAEAEAHRHHADDHRQRRHDHRPQSRAPGFQRRAEGVAMLRELLAGKRHD